MRQCSRAAGKRGQAAHYSSDSYTHKHDYAAAGPPALTVSHSHSHSHHQTHKSHHRCLQAHLLDILLCCIPSSPACPLLPGVVMDAARLPVQLLADSGAPVNAACAVAGWCAEGWLLDDAQHLRDAALTLTTALKHYCE
jgi:hypothetical protein